MYWKMSLFEYQLVWNDGVEWWCWMLKSRSSMYTWLFFSSRCANLSCDCPTVQPVGTLEWTERKSCSGDYMIFRGPSLQVQSGKLSISSEFGIGQDSIHEFDGGFFCCIFGSYSLNFLYFCLAEQWAFKPCFPWVPTTQPGKRTALECKPVIKLLSLWRWITFACNASK